jgi:macrolide transport system ATP-binding/permease protein
MCHLMGNSYPPWNVQGGFFMLLMQGKNIYYSIGDKDIVAIPELVLYKGARIGLVGRNGAGKTTLLKILGGKLDVDGVSIVTFGKMAYFQQIDDETQPFENWNVLSEGEKTAAKLKSILSQNADVLLLDEPTNNLDWQRIEQLESELKHYSGAVVIASHDRSLLDAVCNEIWELEDGKLNIYKGNYASYREQKEVEKKQRQLAYENYSKERKRLLEAYRKKLQQSQNMDRPPSRMGHSESALYKNKAAAKQKKIERVSKVLSSRIERLEKVEKPFEWTDIKMELDIQTQVYRKTMITGKNLTKAFGDSHLYTIPYFKIRTGSKTALLGRNGSGKTTLLKQIVSREAGIEIAEGAKIGVFEQQLDVLPLENTIIQYVQEESLLPQHIIRIILARLRFFADDVHKKISQLSGGERVKVALAKLLVGDYNLLLLDEPTNHLDVEALEALEDLLLNYKGTVLVISHDRRFVEKVADSLLIIENGTLTSFAGTYEQWKESKQEHQKQEKNSEERLRLENRLAQLIGKISIPSPKDDVSLLEREYEETLQLLRQLQDK